MRPAIGIDGDVGEYALSHFYLFCTQAAANPAFNFDSNRCVANTLDIAETADLITDHYWTMKFHTGNGDSNDSAASAPRRYRAARKVHLTKQPTAENVTIWIGIGRHCNCTHSRLGRRCRFVSFERLCE